MATVTLRPDGATTSPDVPTTYGGAASLQAAASDNSDATYVRLPDFGSIWYVDYAMATTVIPANSQIRSVTPRVRHNNASPVSAIRGFTVSVGTSAFPAEAFDWVNGFTTQTGAVRTTQPDGSAWTQAAIDALVMRVSKLITGSYASNIDVAEVYLDVVYNVAPVAVGTALGTVGTSRPTFGWSYSDTEGDPQERFRVKVFSAAQYGAGGFDPNTATPIVDSGEVSSSTARSWTSTIDLDNAATYRAFIAVSDAGSNGRYSAITAAGPYSSATISLTAPNTPTLSATTDGANGRITLAIAATNNLNPANTYGFLVQRSDDNGTTWSALNRLWYAPYSTTDYVDLNFFGTTTSINLTLYDYESLRGAVVPQYRVRAVAFKSGNNLVSNWSSVATPGAALPVSGWRLRSVLAPNTVIALNVHSETVTWSSEERQSVLYALGRSKPVVLSDVIGGETLDLELSMLSDAEYRAFEAMRALKQVLLLQTSYGDHRYVRLGGKRSATHMLNTGGIRKYVVAISLVEVDV